MWKPRGWNEKEAVDDLLVTRSTQGTHLFQFEFKLPCVKEKLEDS
jgi:hypothetical protein